MIENEPLYKAPKNKFRALKYFLVLFFLILISYFLSDIWIKNQKIKKIEVVGNQALTKNEIIFCSIDTSGGKHRGDINLSEIKFKLELNQLVDSAEITMENEDELKIKVYERKPLAAILKGNGELEYIDKEMKFLPYALFSVNSDVPCISNANLNNGYDTSKIQLALSFLNKLNSLKEASFYHNISELIFYDKSSKFYLISSDTGLKIFVPEQEDELVFKNLDYAWRKISNLISTSNVSYVDFRWKNRIVIGYAKIDSVIALN